LISVICESFNCTPKEALKQDPKLVFGILDYRMAESVKRQFNDDASKMTAEEVKFMKKMQDALKEENN
tara:strand:+ start:1121 stop:1324 length:204 start_codon:yes stop_codon:yes gene_type:complete